MTEQERIEKGRKLIQDVLVNLGLQIVPDIQQMGGVLMINTTETKIVPVPNWKPSEGGNSE